MPSKKLFVGNLPDGTTNDELREIFAEHGDVAECDVIKNYAFIVRIRANWRTVTNLLFVSIAL